MLINSAIQFARVFTTRGLREAREESRRWALSAEPGRRGRATPCKGLPVAGTARLSQVHGDCPWSPPGCGYGDIVDGVLSTSRGRRSGLGRDGSGWGTTGSWCGRGGLQCSDGRPLAVGSLPCSSGTLWNGAQDSRARPGACLCVAVPLWPDVHVLTFPFTTFIDFFPLLKCLGYSRKFRKHR